MPRYIPPARSRRSGGSWPRGLVVPAGSMVRRPVLPPSVAPHNFATPARVAIGPDGFAQGIVSAGGICTVRVGPSGFNSSWDLAQASLTTTTGAADASTASLYAQPNGPASPAFQVGQSYAGGGDQIGLAGVKLVTGESLIVVWSGGHPGDTATLVLSGVKQVLT